MHLAEFQRELYKTFLGDGKSSGPAVIHSNIGMLGFVQELNDRPSLLQFYRKSFEEISEIRDVLLPAFNYGFCASGQYDILYDEVQVGLLNEFLRKNSWRRTTCPVFNFIFRGSNSCNWSEYEELRAFYNPFDEFSVWEGLYERGAYVYLVGVPISVFTGIHYVEEKLNVPYRFIKDFSGNILIGGKKPHETVLNYRVRPKFENASLYDWGLIEHDLLDNKLINISSLGMARILTCDFRGIVDYWVSRLEGDIHYFLQPKSIEATHKMYNDFGRPLLKINLPAELV